MNDNHRKILVDFRKTLLDLVRAITAILNAKDDAQKQKWDRIMRGQLLTNAKKFLERVKPNG